MKLASQHNSRFYVCGGANSPIISPSFSSLTSSAKRKTYHPVSPSVDMVSSKFFSAAATAPAHLLHWEADVPAGNFTLTPPVLF